MGAHEHARYVARTRAAHGLARGGTSYKNSLEHAKAQTTGTTRYAATAIAHHPSALHLKQRKPTVRRKRGKRREEGAWQRINLMKPNQSPSLRKKHTSTCAVSFETSFADMIVKGRHTPPTCMIRPHRKPCVLNPSTSSPVSVNGRKQRDNHRLGERWLKVLGELSLPLRTCHEGANVPEAGRKNDKLGLEYGKLLPQLLVCCPSLLLYPSRQLENTFCTGEKSAPIAADLSTLSSQRSRWDGMGWDGMAQLTGVS